MKIPNFGLPSGFSSAPPFHQLPFDPSMLADPSQFAVMLQNLQTKQSPNEPKDAPVKVHLNEKGELVDEVGHLVELSESLATVKANLNRAAKTKKIKVEKVPDIRENKYFDESIAPERQRKMYRGFHFIEAGSIARKAERIRNVLRARTMVRQRQATDSGGSLAQSSSAALNPNLTPLGKPAEALAVQPADDDLEEPPLIEWWDLKLLSKDASAEKRGYSSIDDTLSSIRTALLTAFVEHPVVVCGPNKEEAAGPLPLMLTAAERKKVRTQGRVAREKEKQEQIRLGLVEAPKPKVKVSNLMRVLGTEATQDPTAMEKFVRDEMEARRSAHDARNQARKLTDEQRKEKKEKKLVKEAESDPLVTLFAIGDLTSRQKLFKVNQNAQQFKLTGCVVITPDTNMVLVEGGRKPMRKYIHLMTERIKWEEDTIGGNPNDDPKATPASPSGTAPPPVKSSVNPKWIGSPNWCRMLWQGSVGTRQFVGFRMQHFATAEIARKYFLDRGCPHYWDMAQRTNSDAADATDALLP